METCHPLWNLYRTLTASAAFVDLTHAFQPGQPRFHTFPDEERGVISDHAKGDDSQVHRYSFVGQWGTHIDPPVHFIPGGRTLDEIAVSQMLLPLVVLDISGRVALDNDAVVTLEDLEQWEARNGRIPTGSFVALRTDWHFRWPDQQRFRNLDSNGISHTPGWSMPVLESLLDTYNVTAIGHEQLDTDPGLATSKGESDLERYLLSRDRWQIELMKNLDKVPEAGALILASWPKPAGGSGFPARAVAIIPGE